MKQAGLGCIALLFAGLAQGLPYDFSCPTTNVNPAFALGYGYFDLDPTPAQAPYAPTAGISPSTFFISSATTAGFLQVWCANASTVVPPLGDGTDNFALPGQPEATVGCGLLKTVSTTPTVTKNVTFSIGGSCPTSVLDNSSPIYQFVSTPAVTPQGMTCAAVPGGLPRALQGAGDYTSMFGRLAIGSNNVTIGQYGWAHHVLCLLNVTMLPGTTDTFVLWSGGHVASVDIPQQCMLVKIDPAAATLSLAFGPIGSAAGVTARRALTTRAAALPPTPAALLALTHGADAPTCPTNFDNADTITGWVSAQQ